MVQPSGVGRALLFESRVAVVDASHIRVAAGPRRLRATSACYRPASDERIRGAGLRAMRWLRQASKQIAFVSTQVLALAKRINTILR